MASAPAVEWARLSGRSYYDDASALTRGTDGAIYVAGHSTGTLIGQINEGDDGISNGFLTKYDQDGTKLWTNPLESSGAINAPYALTTGTDGAIYVAGVTRGNIDGQINQGGWDGFVTKYNPDGSRSWAKLLGSPGTDSPQALTTGTDGAIYVAGFTDGSLDGQNNLGKECFVTKYNIDGTKAWTRLLGLNGGSEAWSLTTGADGAIYVAGSAAGDGNADVFITKYNPNGTTVWTKLLGSSDVDYARALTTGTDGGIYVAGTTFGSFDGQKNQRELYGSTSEYDAFITKYNPDGAKLWTKLLGTLHVESATALTSGTDGAIYLAGATSGKLDGQSNLGVDAFVTKYDPDGAKVWTKLLGSPHTDIANALAAGTDGAIYVAGRTNGDLLHGQKSSGSTQAFLIKLTDTISLSYPSYSLTSTFLQVNEGDTATFILSTTNVQAGTIVPYVISGLLAADISDGAVNGSVSVNAAGLATISIPILADNVTEGIETLTVTAGGRSASVQIQDTLKQPISTTYTITPSASSVNEGATARFTIAATGAAAGTSVAYTLLGLNTEDITGGEINGSVVLDTLGIGTISVPIAADNKTEGSESLTVTVGSATSTITVNDTSKSASQYYLSASEGVVQEGRVATFTVSAEDAKPGTKISYTISGSGITAKDIVNGKLNGSVAIGSDSTATITVALKEDKTTEGDEDLTVTLTGLGISETITVEDTSTAAPAVATYTLEAIESSIREGEAAEFLLETAGVDAGTKLKYTITGVSNVDLAEKKLTGTVEVGENGTATITIPTATDTLTEGSETLTLSINGQKASVALLDDTSVKVSETLLEGGEISLYKASLGGYVLAAPGLKAGDALDDFVPLKASAIKDYALPKGLSAVLSYDDGSFGLIIKAGTGSKASFSEQKFSEDGIAKGKLAKLSAAQVLAKETASQTDLTGDGVIGDVIAEVYDGDGDANQQDYGLYKTSSGAVVLGSADQSKGDTAGSGVTLMANKTKGWVVPSGTSVVGMAITEGGSLEVLTLRGKQYSAQKFDPETGLIKGKAAALKTAQLDAREYYYNLDLTGDGDISLVGQETMPVGWAV